MKIETYKYIENNFTIMKNMFLIILLVLILVPFISSEESGGLLTAKQNDCILLPQECADCTYIKLTTITLPNMSKLSIQDNMIQDGTSFSYNFCNTSSTGTYSYCTLGDVGGTDTSVCKDFEITLDGKSNSILMIISQIILLLTIIGLFLIIVYKYKNTDFDKKNKEIIDNHKNMGKTMVSGLLYTIFKNYFIWTYFIGWLFIFVLKDIVYRFNSEELYGYFTLIANIYSLGMILVVIYMIGYFYSYMKNSVEILSDRSWGIEE